MVHMTQPTHPLISGICKSLGLLIDYIPENEIIKMASQKFVAHRSGRVFFIIDDSATYKRLQ